MGICLLVIERSSNFVTKLFVFYKDEENENPILDCHTDYLCDDEFKNRRSEYVDR